MAKLLMMIGLPGSGKSTYIKNEMIWLIWPDGWDIIDTDSFIDSRAKELNRDYNEVFSMLIPMATSTMWKNLETSINRKNNIIWDQTNTTIRSRQKKIEGFKKLDINNDYTIGYIVFPPNLKLSLERNDNRFRRIPSNIIRNMADQFEWPDLEKEYWVNSVTVVR